MSMLAERKQKQRWSLNPRGKQWTDDSSKFGQKMLEKMGWKHGKGLGANENGITEHVKLSYKNDQKGMGYKETEQWTEHDDNFSRLLSNLNGGSDRDDAFKADSLHEKAETVRTRINYHKFTKGKDLSRYSEKDLANIFGKKTLKPKNKTEIISDNETENEGVLINKGSITDYFKRKMPDFGTLNSSGLKIGNNGVLTMGSESESERPTFGFGFENAKKRKYEDDTPANEMKQSEIVQQDKRKRTYSEDTIKKTPQKKINEGYEKKKSFSEEHVERIKKKSNKKSSKEKVESNEESEVTNSSKINKKKLKNCEGSEEIKITDKSDFGEPDDKFRVKKSKKNSLKDPEDDQNIEETSTDRIIKGRKKPRSKSEHFEEAPKLNILENADEEDEKEKTKKIKKSKWKLENVENCGFMNVNEEIDDFSEVLEIKNIFHKDSKKIKQNENIFFKIPLEELYDNAEDLSVNIEEIDQETAKAPKKNKNRKSIEDKELYEETQKNGNAISLRNTEENKKFKNKKIKNQESVKSDKNSQNTESLENEEYKSKRVRNQVGDKSDAEITKKRKKKEDFKKNVEDFEGGVFLRHAEGNRNVRKKKNRLGGEEEETTRKFNVKSRSSDDEILRLDEKITKKAKNRNSEMVEESFKRKKTKDSVPENPFDGEEIVKIDEVIPKKLRKSTNVDEDENRKEKRKPKKLKTHEETVEEKVQPIFNIKGKVKKIAEMIDFNKTKAPSVSSKKEEKKKETDMDINLQISTLKRFTQKLMEVSSKIDDKPMVAGVVNPGFDPLYNKVTVAKHVLNTIEESNEEAAEPIESPEPPRLVIEYENGVHKPIFEKHDGIENPCFEDKPEPQGIENPALDISDTDLVLNVVTTPILKCERPVSRSARKNVRFSNRNEERIIPNNGFVNNGFFDGDDRSFFEGAAKPDGDRSGGVDNVCFDARSQRLSEKVETMSKGIENCQAELDNDINELKRWKSDDLVGEIGKPTEGHAPVSEGVRLSFRNVRFGRSPHWMSTATTQAKKSYKHLIRGDIIVAFKNSNLHQINGYGAEEPKKPVW